MTEELIHLAFVIAEAVIMVLLPVLITAAIARIRDVRIRVYAETLVRYAAQRIPDNSTRYSYVAAELARRYKLNERDVAHLIEATVNAVKQAATPVGEATK